MMKYTDYYEHQQKSTLVQKKMSNKYNIMKESICIVLHYIKFYNCVKSTPDIEYGKQNVFTNRPRIEYSIPIRSNTKPTSGFVSHCMSATMCPDLGSLYIRLYMQPGVLAG